MTDVRTNCTECGAEPGQYHDLGCFQERCLFCGRQFVQCLAGGCPECPDLEPVSDDVDEIVGEIHALARRTSTRSVPDGDRLPWAGTDPGVEAAMEWGWWSRFVPGRGWVPCGPGEVGVRPGEGLGLAGSTKLYLERGIFPDVNRVILEASWSRELRRWVQNEALPVPSAN